MIGELNLPEGEHGGIQIIATYPDGMVVKLTADKVSELRAQAVPRRVDPEMTYKVSPSNPLIATAYEFTITFVTERAADGLFYGVRTDAS